MGIYNINGLELENKFVRVTGFNVGNFASAFTKSA